MHTSLTYAAWSCACIFILYMILHIRTRYDLLHNVHVKMVKTFTTDFDRRIRRYPTGHKSLQEYTTATIQVNESNSEDE
jgi:hypothetical protein